VNIHKTYPLEEAVQAQKVLQSTHSLYGGAWLTGGLLPRTLSLALLPGNWL